MVHFFPVLVSIAEKNLATLLQKRTCIWTDGVLDATKVVLHSAHLETNTFNYTYIEH
jgi:hypothetical protein